jgi:hypothetical protein
MSLQQEITCDIVLQYTQIAGNEQPEFVAERFPRWTGRLHLSRPALRPCLSCARAERSPRSPPACSCTIRAAENPHRVVFD